MPEIGICIHQIYILMELLTPNLKRSNSMPKKKEIDLKALLKMIEGGDTQADIMEKFGFKNSSQLKVAYMNAMIESGKAPEIKRGRKSKATVDTRVAVNGRGTLVIGGDVERVGSQNGNLD